MVRIWQCTAALAMLAFMGGCASIVEGTDQTVTVKTDPSGARCELKRDGATIGMVNPTPGSIVIDKSKDNVSVLCEKEDYQQAAGSLRSELQGMTFGNILFGGLIGVAVDASSGAMNEYPNEVTVTLAPEEFPSRAARDRFYDRRGEEVRAEAKAAITRVRTECRDAEHEKTCEDAIENVKERRDNRLADLELERANARIATY